MKITKRELIVSISIISIMLIIGFFISGAIIDYQNEKNAEYQKVIHIQDTELFQYSMNTNAGNAFVYGDLVAIDPVTYPEIGGEYMYVEKVKEIYIMHTRTVTYTDSKGKTQTRTETYWSWDRAGSEEITCKEVEFCGVAFETGKIKIPAGEYIKTINEFGYIRYKYYGVSTKHIGTIYTKLADRTISENSRFFNGKTPEEAVKSLTVEIWNFVFWIVWLLLTSGVVTGFYYLDNKWLED